MPSATTQRMQPILVVEDNEADFFAIERGLSRGGLANPLVHCVNAESALDYLQQRDQAPAETAGGRGAEGKPGLILLDINLPGMNGIELLQAIKKDPQLRRIPVIMLTTSADPLSVAECYDHGANSYVAKPVDMTGLVESLGKMKDFWFSVAVLPVDKT